MPDFLERLGLDTGADERAIRQAYARLLKHIDQETDAAGFQALREAYEAARQWARGAARAPAEEQPVPAAAAPAPAAAAPAPPEPPAPPAPAVQAAPPAVQEPPLPSPDIAAQAVFAVFYTHIEASPPASEAAARQALDEALGDEGLTNLDARGIFEWGVADLLASGWRPGHEFLFTAALAVFRWEAEARRLGRFGPAGQFIDAAIVEKLAREADPPAARTRQDELIRQLRQPGHPGVRTLMTELGLAEELAARFPHWMSLQAPRESLSRWQQWARSTTPRGAPPEPAPAASTGWARPMFSMLWAIFMLLLVTKSCWLAPDRPPQAIAAQLPSSLHQAPDIDSIGGDPGSVQPGSGALAQAGGRVPLHAAEAPLQAIPPQTLAALTKGKPTASRCDEAASWARRLAGDAPPVPAFDRLIVDCVVAKLWPRPGYDPAVTAALQREQKRSNLEIQRLLADMRHIKPRDAAAPAPGASATATLAPTPPDSDPLGLRRGSLPPADSIFPQGVRPDRPPPHDGTPP